MLIALSNINICLADPIGRVFEGVGVRPLTYWECVFESRWGHASLPLVSVVCCQVVVSATGRSLLQTSSTAGEFSNFQNAGRNVYKEVAIMWKNKESSVD